MHISNIKLKKAAALFAALSMLMFAGCEGEVESPEETEETGEPVETVAVTDDKGNPVTDEEGNPVTEAAPEPIVYKVGFIYNNSAAEGSTNKIFESARAQIEKTLGVDTCYIENVLVGDVPMAVNKLKDEECNIIVSCSPRFVNSVSKEAGADKDTYFLNFGGTDSGSNMSGFGGELYQTASVCGIAAAHNTVSNSIGIVADPAEYNAYGIVDGFTLGAAEIWGAYTNVHLNWAWSNEPAQIEAAVDDLISSDCDIIMVYMNSDYAAEYCNKKGVKVIANAFDLPELAPETYLTGYYFNFGTYLVDEIRSIQNDNFVSRVYAGDIGAGCARLLNFSDICEDGTDTISSALYDYIKVGKAHTFTGEIKNTDGKIMVEKGQQLGFAVVRDIKWLVQGIRSVGDFTTITENPVSSDFEIHY